MPIMQTLLQTPNVSPFIPMQVVNGRLTKGGNTPVDLQGCTSIISYAFNYAFYLGLQKVGFVNFNIKNIQGDSVFAHCFQNCSYLVESGVHSIETIIGSSALDSYCNGCNLLTNTGLENLKKIEGSYATRLAFWSCVALQETSLNNVENIKGQRCCYRMFGNCTGITSATFNKLEYVYGIDAMEEMFYHSGITSLYFMAFNSDYGYLGDPFTKLLTGVSNCTVHFYKYEQNQMSDWNSVVNGMGGTNTTILFDQGITATVSIPSGYKVIANGIDITNESTFDFREGNNEIIYVTPNNEIGNYTFVADQTTTSFVLEIPSGVSYRTFTCTSNLASATYSVTAKFEKRAEFTLNNISNNVFYCMTGYQLHVVAETSEQGYFVDPIDTTSAQSKTLTFTFMSIIGTDVYDTSNFLSSITGDTSYASVDTTNNQLLYHYPNDANWTGSVQIALNVPAGTTAIMITTRAYVSSEANYDFGYLALGTARANPQPTYQNVKNGTIANGVYLFKQSGTNNVMTDVSYKTLDATQNVLTVGYAQDGTLKGTNTLYVEPITIKYLQGA